MYTTERFYGLSKPVTPINVFASTIIKELKIAIRYRANLIGDFYEVLLIVFSFYIFGSALSFRTLTDVSGSGRASSAFIFCITGIVLVLLLDVALWTPLNSVTNDLYNGTLEYLYSTSFPRYSYYLGTIVAAAIIRLIYLVPIVIGIAFFGELSQEVIFLSLVILASMISLVGVGIIIALSAIMWKETSGIAQILGLLFQFLVGAFIPVQSFPVWLKWIAFLFPQTFAYDLSRYYAFKTKWPTLLPVEIEWMILLLSIPLYFGVSIYLLKKVENYSKKGGLHLI